MRWPLLWAALLLATAAPSAQAPLQPPREFPAFAGTWQLDDGAGAGRIAGLPVARTLVVATSPTEISLVKDSAVPEIYRLDGTELSNDARCSGIPECGRRTKFTLVAEMLALTTMLARPAGEHTLTDVITDAYAVSGDVLTVERQLSVVVRPVAPPSAGAAGPAPPGWLATLSVPANNRQTIVYRRQQAPAR